MAVSRSRVAPTKRPGHVMSILVDFPKPDRSLLCLTDAKPDPNERGSTSRAISSNMSAISQKRSISYGLWLIAAAK